MLLLLPQYCESRSTTGSLSMCSTVDLCCCGCGLLWSTVLVLLCSTSPNALAVASTLNTGYSNLVAAYCGQLFLYCCGQLLPMLLLSPQHWILDTLIYFNQLQVSAKYIAHSLCCYFVFFCTFNVLLTSVATSQIQPLSFFITQRFYINQYPLVE